MQDTRLGAILLENPVIREEDLERCLQIQSLTNERRPLGQVLVDEGVIDQRTLEELLETQRTRREHSLTSPQGELTLEQLLVCAVGERASDLVLDAGRPPMLRVADELQPLGDQAVSAEKVRAFAVELLGQKAVEELRGGSVIETITIHDVGRLRVTLLAHARGLALSVRLHPQVVRGPADFGLDGERLDGLLADKGLVLIVGERRSGRSELLSTCLARTAHDPQRLVLLLDENLENAETPENGAVVVRRRIGTDTWDHGTALQAAIGSEADVILVGDVSTPDHFEQALRLADNGRLVVAGFHAPDIMTAIRRIFGFHDELDHQRFRGTLAAALRGAIGLRLLPRGDGHGMVAATELLVLDEVARDLVREGELAELDLLMSLGDEVRGHRLDHSLRGLIESNTIRPADALRHADDKRMVLQWMPGEAR